ncbi:hypothetical protein C8R47DRAFT_1329271 [Mycena vitilis]|nr:hypothetical protein C8R47DRAFT_1329271 [Mycena vitilis]
MPPMVFAIYMPKAAPKLKETADCSPFTQQELHAFEQALPSGGTICSTHYPKDALSWVEAHYSDALLACMRLRGTGGPVATMLSPEMQALALFGSIRRKWVLWAAQTLADISGFPVIIQPRSDDPLLQWNKLSGNSGGSNIKPSDGDGDATGGDGMAPPTDEDHIDIYAGWMSPVHRSDIRLQLCAVANITHDVTIHAETQFKVQHMFEDKYRNGFRPQVISRTHLQVTSSDLRVLPNRSHSNIGFFSREQWVVAKEWYNCGFDVVPRRRISKARKHRFPPFLSSLVQTSEEERNDLDDAEKWTVTHGNGRSLMLPNGSEFVSWDVAYDARVKNVNRPMEVAFSMGLDVVKGVDPRSAAPNITYLCRNQTSLWVPNNELKSKGFGMIIATSTYIRNCQSRTPTVSMQDIIVNLGTSPADAASPQSTRNHILRPKGQTIACKPRNSLLGRWHRNFDLSHFRGDVESFGPSLGWVPELKWWTWPIYPALNEDLVR